jgi:hypothetical protein
VLHVRPRVAAGWALLRCVRRESPDAVAVRRVAVLEARGRALELRLGGRHRIHPRLVELHSVRHIALVRKAPLRLLRGSYHLLTSWEKAGVACGLKNPASCAGAWA